jgi:hypothetical protein
MLTLWYHDLTSKVVDPQARMTLCNQEASAEGVPAEVAERCVRHLGSKIDARNDHAISKLLTGEKGRLWKFYFGAARVVSRDCNAIVEVAIRSGLMD